MAFNLAGFAEGLHPTLQALAKSVHDGQIAKIQLNNLIGQAGQADPNQQGAPPPQGGPPAPAPMPGATPMPPQADGAPVAPGASMSMPQSLAALDNPSATQTPSPMQDADVQPPPAGQPAGGGQSPGAVGGASSQGGAPSPVMSGVAQPTGNEFQDSQKTLKSILLDLKQRNPKARPAQILEAAQQQIAMMKGLAPDTIALLRAQTAAMGIDQKYSEQLQKAKTAEEALQVGLQKQQEKLDAMQKIVDEQVAAKQAMETGREGSNERIAGTRAAATVGAAQVRGAAEEATGAGHDAASRANTGARVAGTAAAAGARNETAVTTAMIRANSAAIAKGKKPPYPHAGAGTKDNPAKPKTPAEAKALGAGTWIERPDNHAVVQVK